MNRRQFIVGAGAFVAGHKLLAAGVGCPKLRLGVVSDIHIMKRGLPDELYIYGSDTVFRKTLRFFRERGVDAVVLPGDLANTGRFDELKVVADDWREAFPGNKGADGRPVEPVFVYGNHDLYRWGNKPTDDLIPNDPADAWKRAFGWNWSPVEKHVVKGYTFLCAHWGHEKDLAEYIAAHKAELAGEKPFFCVQHPHPKGTVAGDWDSGLVTAALAGLPNAVVFSGHSHTPLADDRTVWQGAFTSIGASALSYLLLPPDCVDGHRRDPQAPMPWGSDLGKDAMIVEVFDDRLVLERRQVVDDDEIAEARVIPLPAREGAGSFSFEAQQDRASAPEFPSGAVLREWREQGTSRDGSIQNQVVLEFPSALAGKNNGRAIRYLVDVFAEGRERPIHSACYLAPFFFRNPRHAPKAVVLRIAVDVLPKDVRLRYEVRAENCWGMRGKSLTCGWRLAT